MKAKIYWLLALVWLVPTACSDFGNINESPNASPTPLTSALLTNALTVIGGSTTNGANLTAGLYCQYYSETLYTDASRYSVQNVDWSGELAGSVYDLQNIININSDPATAAYASLNGSNANQIAIARILKAYRFSILTDRYGDMPYSEALKGQTQPKYDLQKDIYSDLFKELKEAALQFDNGSTVKGDILFNGDNLRWKQFANSLRLILALRISEVDETLGKSVFNDVLNNLSTNGGVLEKLSDDIYLDYPGTSNAFSNPWYAIGGDFNVSTTIADLLNSTGDLRRIAFGNVSGNGNLIGVPPGLQRQDAIAYTTANPTHSLVLNSVLRAQTSRLKILTSADIWLARAEAAERSWTAEDTNAAYQKGIELSWSYWLKNINYSSDFSAPLTNYLNSTSIDLNAGSPLQKICTQRWITFYPNGPQGWSEWRRTGFPSLSPSPSPVNNSGQIPVRFIYPTVEYALNKKGVTEAVSRLDKADTQDSHVWWDK